MIDLFQGEYEYLSNFFPSRITIEGKEYATVEHYYQTMKTLDPIERVKIRLAKSPNQAKWKGRKCTLREDWEEVKFLVMEIGLRAKFEIEWLADMLKYTSPNELIEGNHWGDMVWGIDYDTRLGENRLGKLLMKIREELLQ